MTKGEIKTAFFCVFMDQDRKGCTTRQLNVARANS